MENQMTQSEHDGLKEIKRALAKISTSRNARNAEHALHRVGIHLTDEQSIQVDKSEKEAFDVLHIACAMFNHK